MLQSEGHGRRLRSWSGCSRISRRKGRGIVGELSWELEMAFSAPGMRPGSVVCLQPAEPGSGGLPRGSRRGRSSADRRDNTTRRERRPPASSMRSANKEMPGQVPKRLSPPASRTQAAVSGVLRKIKERIRPFVHGTRRHHPRPLPSHGAIQGSVSDLVGSALNGLSVYQGSDFGVCRGFRFGGRVLARAEASVEGHLEGVEGRFLAVGPAPGCRAGRGAV